VADVRLMIDAAEEARERGCAVRPVRLRDGNAAELHVIEIGNADQTTVTVIVPATPMNAVPVPTSTAMVASPRIGVVRCNGFGAITSASASTMVLLGSPEDSVVGKSVMEMLHPDDQEMAIVNWLAAKEHRGVALRWRCRLTRADQTALWVEVTITNAIEADGSGEVHLDLADISEEVAATDALIAERELLALVTETLPVGVAKFAVDGRLEHSNGRLGELLAPLVPEQLIAQAARGELEDAALAGAFAALLQDGVGCRLVIDHDGVDGASRHLEWTIRAAFDPDGAVTGGVLCIADVTEAARLRDALESRARTDALTGCLNRAGTIAALEQALANPPRGHGVGLLFIDLDGLKGINDSLGHAVGDAVLVMVATRLRGSVRVGDIVGRLGGDEFVVIAPGLSSASLALDFAGRVFDQVEGPAMIGAIEVPIEASVGVAWTLQSTVHDLLGAADAAMYIAKQTRANGPVLSDKPGSEAIGELAAI
jgi:diguanylate cyclase (GGDEF)-like protein